MDKHRTEIVDLITAIQFTVKLLGYDIVTEHNQDKSKLFIFNKQDNLFAISYNHGNLIVFYEDITLEINDHQGLSKQIDLLKQFLKKL